VDITEQGLLKMLDMSGTGDFVKDFDELSIVPVSISYEYEPCDYLKAKELYISRRARYKKSPGEDLNSILTGIMQYKGRVHTTFNRPIEIEELKRCSKIGKNGKFKELAEIIDKRIYSGYKVWNTNKISSDLLTDNNKYSSAYTKDEFIKFKEYFDSKTSDFTGDKSELKEIFLSIYANALLNCI